MVSEVRFQLAIGKIAAHLRGSCLSVILHWQLQRNNFFLNTQLKLAQKREPLFWQYTVCKLFKCNNKISLFDLIMCSQSGKGEVGMFVLSIHCMKKSPTSKNMILRKGKKSMKGEFKWDFERLKWDFCWIAKLLFEYKGILVFLNNIFCKTFWD